MKKIKILFTLLICIFLASSCEKEVTSIYSYQVSTFRVSEVGSSMVGMGTTMDYLTNTLGWNKTETIDNDASSLQKAQEINDAEAVAEFRSQVAAYNELVLFEQYKRRGVESAKGDFTYRVVRVSDNAVLDSCRFTINYPPAN